MEEATKRKRGQPKKRPTYTKGLRVDKEMLEFLKSLPNANQFLVAQIKSTQEYQNFLEKKREQDLEKYPSLTTP